MPATLATRLAMVLLLGGALTGCGRFRHPAEEEPLPVKKAEEEKAQVSKVKNFLKDAQEALKTGDAEGAKTLATKAKLLMDDLEKR